MCRNVHVYVYHREKKEGKTRVDGDRPEIKERKKEFNPLFSSLSIAMIIFILVCLLTSLK